MHPDGLAQIGLMVVDVAKVAQESCRVAYKKKGNPTKFNVSDARRGDSGAHSVPGLFPGRAREFARFQVSPCAVTDMQNPDGSACFIHLV
jgi:hypothetical protein